MRHRCFFALLMLAGWPAYSDINTSFLPERPSSTLQQALARAVKENKAVFLILYDDRETVANTLQFFFDSPAVKQHFKNNFVVCVRDRRRPDVAAYSDPTQAWNRARFVVLTPAGKQIDAGRFLRNDEAGVNAVEEAVQKWLSNKVVTPPKPGKPQ
jgi:hypothetical protein